MRRPQWLRRLRRGSATARLQGLRVRIPPRARMSVSCECRVLSGREVSATGRSLDQKSYRVWCVWVWSRRGLDPVGPSSQENKIAHISVLIDTLNSVISLNGKDHYKDRLVFVMAMQWVSLRRQKYNCYNYSIPIMSLIIWIYYTCLDIFTKPKPFPKKFKSYHAVRNLPTPYASQNNAPKPQG